MRSSVISILLLFFLFFLFFNSFSAKADSTEHLAPVQFTGSATFETLRDDTFVPVEVIPFDQSRTSTYDALKYQTNYPGQNYGFPSGASGISLGGRSITDTQVTTLGVPINLAQGGGADFSFFPGFMWNSAKLSPTTTSGGFAPQAVSGSIELLPWTREMLRNNSNGSRFTMSYDRDVQTFSVGTRSGDIALLAGMTTGRESGPAGEISYQVYDHSGAQILLHVLRTDQTGDSPGSQQNPTPFEVKKAVRTIPVVESHFDLGGNWIFESTAFGDIQDLQLTDPTSAVDVSNTRTEQFGIENALVHGADTLALSARYVLFDGHGAFGQVHEWPVFAAFTHELWLSDQVSTKATLNEDYTSGVGINPGGKLSTQFSADQHQYPYLEFNSIPKMPSLVDRYAYYPSVFGNFYGNPSLKPERVNNAILGYQYDQKPLKSTSSIKAEYRTQIQIASPDFTTTINAGNAYLYVAEEALNYEFSRKIVIGSRTTYTYSRLVDSKLPYPDLPAISEGASFQWNPIDTLKFESNAKLMGVSTTSGGGVHPAYTLFDQAVSYTTRKGLTLAGGIDNIFNNHAEVVVGYPLEGRIAYLSLQSTF